MKVLFESKFAKDLSDTTDDKVLAKINTLILECKQAESIIAIKNIKKLRGYKTLYRIRIGNYRLGVEIIHNEIIFTRCLHRKNIYKYFP